jgi:hypothetical protein
MAGRHHLGVEVPMPRRPALAPLSASASIVLLALGCETASAPLEVAPETPPTCETAPAAAELVPVADAGAPAAASPATVPDAGATPIRTTIGLWFSNGFVQDMLAAGFGTPADYHFHVADAFTGFVSYGFDMVTLNQSGVLGHDLEGFWVGPPDMLIVGDYIDDPNQPVVPRTGYWLAQLVWDGMTRAVVTTKGDVTIRESPGGRVHCERSSRQLQCGFHGVVRADLR